MVLIKIKDNWALVSKTNSNKILKWFGPKKPTPVEVEKEERRVQFFKALSQGKIKGEKLRKAKLASVRKHTRRDGSVVKAHFRKIRPGKKRGSRNPNYR